jgi:hypothetical protein
MADSDLSISQLSPLTLPVQGSDLLHISRAGDDYRINRSDLVKTFLSQIADVALSGAASGHALVYNPVTSKWENGFISWAMVSGKPSQFTPVVHTHLWDEITDAPTELPPSPHMHAWTDLTGVPSSFLPALHTHRWGDLTNVPADFPPESHVHQWSEITGKPLTFPPDIHNHASLYYSKVELSTSGAGGQVHWDNITHVPDFGTGSGDMSRSVYDLNDDGIVEQAASVPWSGITGKPGTFPADPHTHDGRYFTKTELSEAGAGGSVHWDNIADKPITFGGDMATDVYDLDGDGVVDHAESVPWTGITGTPATFPPATHTHDDLYSLLGHNHDASYPGLMHTHSQYLADAPVDGKTYSRKDGAWAELTGSSDTGMTFIAGINPPTEPNVGDEWFDTNTGTLFKFVDDGTSSQWVEVSTGGYITTNHASGMAVLASAFDISGANQVFQDSGLALSLPAAGTYAIDGSIRGVVANNMSNCQIYVKLYNATAGADISDTETLVIYSQQPNVLVQNTISLTAIVTVTVPTTIKLYAARSMEAGSTWSFSRLDSNWAGKTRMRFIKIG